MQSSVQRVLVARSLVFSAVLFSFVTTFAQSTQNTSRLWMARVRIGAYGLKSDNAAEIVRKAEESGVYGIEVDNDIPGRYESFVDPTPNSPRFVTLLGSRNSRAIMTISTSREECITANAASATHSMAKDHPDWLQRNIAGKPAIFTGGTAFWIRKGDEDVWVTPLAPGWRKVYMERVRQIAATEIDGIYVDVPYWMMHFTG